jgi:hypothetical protein
VLREVRVVRPRDGLFGRYVDLVGLGLLAACQSPRLQTPSSFRPI